MKVILFLIVFCLHFVQGQRRLNAHVPHFDGIQDLSFQYPGETPLNHGFERIDPQREITMSFHTLGRNYKLTLRPNTHTLLDSRSHSQPPRRAICYEGHLHDSEQMWARITLSKANHNVFSGMIHTPDQVVVFSKSIDALTHPETQEEAKYFIESNSHATVSFVLNDIELPSDHTHKATPLYRLIEDGKAAVIPRGSEDESLETEQLSVRGEQDTGKCFRSEGEKYFVVGIAFDSGFLDVSNTDDIRYLALEIVNRIDGIYSHELGIRVKLGPVHERSITRPESWDDRPIHRGLRCPVDISTKLTVFTNWRSEASDIYGNGPDQAAGFWVLLTNCYPGPGIIGLANTGAICQKQTETCDSCSTKTCYGCHFGHCKESAVICSSGTAVVSHMQSSLTFYVAAHELAHGLGSPHTHGHGLMAPKATFKDQYFTLEAKKAICRNVYKVEESGIDCFKVN